MRRTVSDATGSSGNAEHAASDTASGAADTAEGACSFAASTLVALPGGGEQAIASLHMGQTVLAYNPATHASQPQAIQAVSIHHDDNLLDVTLRVVAMPTAMPTATPATTPTAHAVKPAAQPVAASQTHDETVHTTSNHPWLTADHAWLPASFLRIGEPVMEANGSTAVVVAVRSVSGAADMWDLTVANLHDFAVGTGQFVVHNCGPNDIVNYGDKTQGLEKHHGVMDAWAKHNIQGYVSRAADAPTIALTQADHAATKAVFRQWLFDTTGKAVGGVVDWAQVSARDIFSLSERMFDAAHVPSEARSTYYRAFNRYIYTGAW